MINQDLLISIQQKYKKLRLYLFLMLLILAAALSSVFFNRIVALILLGLAILYHLVVLRRQQKLYSDEITMENLKATIQKILCASEISKKNGGTITVDTITKAAMMPMRIEKGSPLLCWGMSGTLGKYPVSICDATIGQDFELKEKGRKRVHFNSGVWIHFTLPEDSGMRWCLIDEAAVPTPIRMEYFSKKMNMETASVGNEDIGKRCVLYQPSDSGIQLSDSILLAVKQLLDYTPGYPAISVKGNSVDIFLRGRFLARPVSMSKAPTKELMEFDPFPELSYLSKIVKAVENTLVT